MNLVNKLQKNLKKTLVLASAIPLLSLAGCNSTVSVPENEPTFFDTYITETFPTFDENAVNELIENTPEGYTLLGDAVSGWHYVCTSSSCRN